MKNYNLPPVTSASVEVDQTLRQHGYSDRATEEDRLSAAETRKALRDEASSLTTRPRPRSSTNSFAAFEADATDAVKQIKDDRYNALGEDHMALRLTKEHSAEKAQQLNDQAQIEIWGSGNHNKVIVDGVEYSSDKPYPGRIEDIRNSSIAAHAVDPIKERNERADKYEASILDLVENQGFELCQAKLIMDLSEAQVTSEAEALSNGIKTHVLKQYMRMGSTAQEAKQQVAERYDGKSDQEVIKDIIKTKAILDMDELKSLGSVDTRTTYANKSIGSPSSASPANKSVKSATGKSAETGNKTKTTDLLESYADAVRKRDALKDEFDQQQGNPDLDFNSFSFGNPVGESLPSNKGVKDINRVNFYELNNPYRTIDTLQQDYLDSVLGAMNLREELERRKEAGEDIDLSVGDNKESTQSDIAQDGEATEETEEITNQQLLDNQEKLRQLKVAEAHAKAQKALDQTSSDDNREQSPVMKGGAERDPSMSRRKKIAKVIGGMISKAMNWLKESTEIVGEKPQSMFADDGEGLPVDVAHPPIPTPEGGFAESPDNNPSEGLTKTERENDALVLKSREMTKRALSKIEDPGKRKSAEQSLKLFQDMTSSIESELGGYQGTKDSFDEDFNGLRAQAKRKVLVDRINKALLLTTEKNELFAKVDAVIPEDKDFVYNPPRPRSAQTEQASSDLGEATEGQAEVIDIIKPNLDGVGDAIASLEASGEPEQANDEYIATVRQLENLYGDNPELMDQQIALFQDIVNTKRSPSQRIEQPKVVNNEPSAPVGDSGGSRRQQVIAKLNEAS